MKHYQMIEGACACKSFSQDTLPFWGRGSINTRIGACSWIKRFHGESAKWKESIKNEERFKDR